MLFSKMNVAVYMLITEAVVSCASGAITEFQFRIAYIRSAAYGTFVTIGSIVHFSFSLSCGLAEIDCLLGMSSSVRAEHINKVAAEEQQEVCNSN